MVWSDTPSTSAILLNEARPSTLRAWTSARSNSSSSTTGQYQTVGKLHSGPVSGNGFHSSVRVSRSPREGVQMGKWSPLVAVCLGAFMLLVDVTIVTVALPDMAHDLGASFTGLQWV